MVTMRNSKKRDIILKTVRENRIHGTAGQIYDLVKKEIPEISLGTVYRNLQQLSDQNLIQKIVAEDGICRFDGCVAPHSHLICEHCGKVLDFEYEIVPEFAETVHKKLGFSCSSLQLTASGICAACRAASFTQTS